MEDKELMLIPKLEKVYTIYVRCNDKTSKDRKIQYRQ